MKSIFKLFTINLLFLLIVSSCSKDSSEPLQNEHIDSIAANPLLRTKTYTENGLSLVVNNNDPEMDTTFRNNLVQLFFKIYPKISERFGHGAPKEIILSIDTNYSEIAYAKQNQIIFGAHYFRRHSTDIDELIIPLTHIVQSYFTYEPVWLTKAIANYVRYTYGRHNEQADWQLPDYETGQNYTSDYLVGARFLVWLENNVDNTIVDQLNRLFYLGQFSSKSWEYTTGKSLSELWLAYTRNPALELPESLQTKQYNRKGVNLTFECNDLYFDTSIRRKLVNTFFSVYIEEMSRFNANAPKDITFLIDTAYSGVAYTSRSQIVYSADYYHSNPTDIDVVTHEAMHLTQGYPHYNPVWLVEGIADYARYVFGMHNRSAGWSLPNYSSSQSYTDSYRVTARFLVWIETNVDDKIVDRLDAALRNDTYTKNTWKEITGRTVDELWNDYRQNPELNLHYN